MLMIIKEKYKLKQVEYHYYHTQLPNEKHVLNLTI